MYYLCTADMYRAASVALFPYGQARSRTEIAGTKRETTPVTVFPTWHVRATTCHVSLRMCRPVSAERLGFYICLRNGS